MAVPSATTSLKSERPKSPILLSSRKNFCYLLFNLHTGLAFDNYDCFVETLSGSDTLHDTVGIVYQDRSDLPNPIINEKSTILTVVFGNRRRWRFQAAATEIPSYNKRNQKWQKSWRDLITPNGKEIPQNLDSVHRMDFLWTLRLFFEVKNCPPWIGWNAKVVANAANQLPLQRVGYLPRPTYSLPRLQRRFCTPWTWRIISRMNVSSNMFAWHMNWP